ncbi:MAG TPA: TMEM175 family protein [Candidatus Sulfotelmatobacter sp.]|jgi:uncharacterized membrane protein|nr:TMEM175 family protein [Candidatus Sulfotelmatobacter sp.]
MAHKARPHASAKQSDFRNLASASSATEISAEAGSGLPAEHRRGLLPERYFRWRAGETTRLEAFCDVVFGFALTLLVVSSEVPRSYAEFLAALRGFLPFAACFAQFVVIWRAHYRFSRRYGLEDPYTVFLNIILLFLVLFYVYPLKFVFTMLFSQITGSSVQGIGFHEASVLMRIYAAGFAAVFTLFALMYHHAYKLRHELQLNRVEEMETRSAFQENVITASVGAISFLFAFKDPGWAGWWFFVLAPALTVHGKIYGKRVKQMAQELGMQE